MAADLLPKAREGQEEKVLIPVPGQMIEKIWGMEMKDFMPFLLAF